MATSHDSCIEANKLSSFDTAYRKLLADEYQAGLDDGRADAAYRQKEAIAFTFIFALLLGAVMGFLMGAK